MSKHNLLAIFAISLASTQIYTSTQLNVYKESFCNLINNHTKNLTSNAIAGGLIGLLIGAVLKTSSKTTLKIAAIASTATTINCLKKHHPEQLRNCQKTIDDSLARLTNKKHSN